MAHGQLPVGYGDTYKYSMDHIGRLLAELGFVCISIQPRPSIPYPYDENAGTAETFVRHLENVNGIFGNPYYIKGKPIALIGHSQAGHAAVEAANLIKSRKTAGYTKVNAVVGLAASPAEMDLSDSYLGMQGSLDQDLGAAGQHIAVQAYEELTKSSDRYFLWMHGCNHRQYTKPSWNYPYYFDTIYPTPDTLGPPPGLVTSTAQHFATANHVGMFLLWKLAAQTEYKSVFTGDEYVKFSSNDPVVQSDFDSRLRIFTRSDKWRQRDLGTLPEAASFQGMLQNGLLISNDKNPAKFASLATLDTTCAGQKGRGFIVGWNLDVFKTAQIKIACIKTVMQLSIKAIEFHAVGIAAKGKTEPKKPIEAEAFLLYGDKGMNTSKTVRILIDPPWNNESFPASILGTVRIPIEPFGLFPDQLADVTTLVIDFSTSPNTSGSVAITGFRVALT